MTILFIDDQKYRGNNQNIQLMICFFKIAIRENKSNLLKNKKAWNKLK